MKTISDEIQSFLSDSSNLEGGYAARVMLPESAEEVAEILRAASAERTPVTVSGAGTGIVGGRVPFGGMVLATDRLNRIKEIRRDAAGGGRAVAEAGVMLSEFQRSVEAESLLYPPDPTERSCYLGGSVATNASGARTFKYGPTRSYISRLKIALATGDLLDISRGQFRAGAGGHLVIPLSQGRRIEARLPSYRMPQTRKHASGYFVAEGMDAIDLFIGSEGTLGVITEVEARLLPVPENVLSGVAFFETQENLLAFVREARRSSLATRARDDGGKGIDARALEYFDDESLRFLRSKFSQVPERARGGAIFFEQETTAATEDELMSAWLQLLERHGSLLDDSWFAVEEKDRARLREFRHQLPVLVNEWLAHRGQRKVSTDMAVPDEEFQSMLRFYKETLAESRLRYVVFGHIGDNHVHVNIMPGDDLEAQAAREIYLRFVKLAVSRGGTISAEHGIGKLKRDYLSLLYTEENLREMAALKRAFDPACILGRGNIFSEEYLNSTE
ncbi:MAG TPA: FAD-binding oxidoreductase [Pyrinomonadaceae bacterium]|jgi:D-lactate dehydrogenase (cytochrome)